MLKRAASIVVLLTWASQGGAESSQTHARNAFNSMMNAERASTQAIRDSMKFVNHSSVRFAAPINSPTPVENKPDPAERYRQLKEMKKSGELK